MDRIDFTNNGGFPLEQETLDFLQSSFSRPLSAIAKLCGDKSIIDGVEIVGGNVTAGWISYNDELVLFQSGPLLAKVVIEVTPLSVTFEDGAIREEYFVKVAKCAALGDFNFSELEVISKLKNMWRKDDIRMKYCDAAYEAANFDVDGYGTANEKGWRIFSKAVPESAGKTFVNKANGDADFGEVGNSAGEKKHQLTKAELPSYNISRGVNNETVAGGSNNIKGNNTGTSSTETFAAGGNDIPHNNLQPYFVILTLIKL